MALAGVGCTPAEPMTSERTASMAPHGALRIQGVAVQEFISRRTGFIFFNVGGIEIHRPPDGPTPGRYLLLDGKGKESGSGMITAIDRRGYFLTAAHVLGHSPSDRLHVLFDDGSGVQTARAEVVWKGDYENGGADFALLRVPVRLQSAFELASRLRVSDLVIGAGPVTSPKPSGPLTLDLTLIAGSIVAVGSGSPPGIWSDVQHSAPTRRGDSGGPLVTMDGRLAGVESRATAAAHGIGPIALYYSEVHRYAVRPATDRFIAELIEQDLVRRTGEQPKASE